MSGQVGPSRPYYSGVGPCAGRAEATTPSQQLITTATDDRPRSQRMFADHPLKAATPRQPSRIKGRAGLGLGAIALGALVSAILSSVATAAPVGQPRPGTGL